MLKFRNLSGIIPVSCDNSKFGQSWPDFLMPVGKGVNLFNRAVWACAMAGCKTIYVVGTSLPICRQTYGDWIPAPKPVKFMKKFSDSTVQEYLAERIPMYYVPLHPDDIGKRDGEVWSVLWAAYVAKFLHEKFSNRVIPKKFLVVSPFSVFDPTEIRKIFSSTRLSLDNFNIFTCLRGKTIKDILWNMPFAFKSRELGWLIEMYKKLDSGKTNKITGEPLLPAQRWSGRQMTFHEIYQGREFNVNSDRLVEIQYFFNIANWDDYHRYIRSNVAYKSFHPSTIEDKRFLPVKLKLYKGQKRTWTSVLEEELEKEKKEILEEIEELKKGDENVSR